MSGWRTHSGPAVGLDQHGIDTDQLIPARFMSTPRTEGYGRFLLHDQRFEEGRPIPGHPLNTADAEDARFLIARRDFGVGSSREAAVYALVDFGIRAVIAPSFGDIFAANAVNNALAPLRVSEAAAESLLSLTGTGATELHVDLTATHMNAGQEKIAFALDDHWRTKIINGWDDIDLTGKHQGAIAAYREADMVRRPWAVVARGA
ncbi:MAG: 3-isopropylmalate dehydratase small subunit [Pseudomonadota bacterium]